jgi:hypothetical protein
LKCVTCCVTRIISGVRICAIFVTMIFVTTSIIHFHRVWGNCFSPMENLTTSSNRWTTVVDARTIIMFSNTFKWILRLVDLVHLPGERTALMYLKSPDIHITPPSQALPWFLPKKEGDQFKYNKTCWRKRRRRRRSTLFFWIISCHVRKNANLKKNKFWF